MAFQVLTFRGTLLTKGIQISRRLQQWEYSLPITRATNARRSQLSFTTSTEAMLTVTYDHEKALGHIAFRNQ